MKNYKEATMRPKWFSEESIALDTELSACDQYRADSFYRIMGCLGIASPADREFSMGWRAFYSTYQPNVCVGLLNLLLQMCFQESKWSNMRQRPGPRYQSPNWTKGEMEGKGGEGRRRWERKMRGGWKTGTGYRREERKGKGEREERCAPTFSFYIHHCLQNSFTLWKQEVTG